jgi:hypothetical protein
MSFFPNQVNAADEIVAIFTSNVAETTKTYYALLWAEVQCGKTGTYNCVIQQMLDYDLVDQVYILCGSSETELRDQAIEDAAFYNPSAVADDKLKVIFRSDFRKYYPSTSTPLVMERTLIVVDESHLDQTQGQQLSKLLAQYGLNMSGSLPVMEEKETYILSVDATPYSELAAHEKDKSLPKHVFQLEAGEGYYGPRQYFAEKRVRVIKEKDTPFKFNAENAPRIQRVLTKYCGQPDNAKYAIVRARGKVRKAFTDICRAYGIRLFSFTTDKTDISIEDLKTKPTELTVVVLDGRLRAGKVVPKEHVGLVWETSQQPNTDVLLQGLIGRMCGYKFGEEKPHILITNNEKVVVDLRRYVNGLVPMRGSNVSGTHREHNIAKYRRFQCPPIRLPCDIVRKSKGSDSDSAHRDLPEAIRSGDLGYIRVATHTMLTMEPRVTESIIDAPFLSSDQKNEILERLTTLTPSFVNVRRMKKNSKGDPSQLAYFADLLRAEDEHTTTVEHIPNAPYFTVVTMKDSKTYKDNIPTESLKSRDTFENGDAWLVCYTDAPSVPAVLYKGPMTGEENGRSVFSIHDLLADPKGDIPSGPTGIHGFTEEAYVSGVEFVKQLSFFVGAWRERRVHVEPVLRDLTKKTKFSRSAFSYETAKKNTMLALVKPIEEEFQCKIAIKFGRGRLSASHFNVEEITWKSV